MNCPKCGTELTKNDFLDENSVQCPGCGAVYRRKSSSEQNKASEPSRSAPRHEKKDLSFDGKNCPYCGSPLLGTAMICPKCHFDVTQQDGGEEHQRWLQRQRESAEKESVKETRPFSAVTHISSNGVANLLKTCAWVIYIGCFILGIVYGSKASNSILSYYSKGFSVVSMLTVWLIGFVSGTVPLSLGEIIKLLHEINEKQDRK